MTTISQLRKAALALPDVEEGAHFGMGSFAVRGKGFVSVTKDGAVQLRPRPPSQPIRVRKGSSGWVHRSAPKFRWLTSTART